MDYSENNALLTKKLYALSEKDKDYWSFKGNSSRGYGHGLFQYPAMMVPQVVEAIIDKIVEVHPKMKTISDPFMGSGTVMTESMIRGLSFSGTDINPLAILLCQVKSGPFFINELKIKSIKLKEKIENDKDMNYEVSFTNQKKWFNKSAMISLSRIRRSIKAEKEMWARRFFWVALAETVRLSSNSRTSTFKLHKRTDKDIIERKNNLNVTKIFLDVLDYNILEYTNLYDMLNNKKFIQDGIYIHDIKLNSADTKELKFFNKVDFIITSPPYGDNATTVPYGQHSYLPLQWIDFSDIDSSLNKDILLETTNEIDYRSLGGKKKIANEEKKAIMQKSDFLNEYLSWLDEESKDKTNKVVAFFRDLDHCIKPILQNLKPGGILVWVLGNRRVGGKQVPLDKILSDLFELHKVNVFCELSRKIHSKRMPLKNNTAETMSDEIILFMRKDC